MKSLYGLMIVFLGILLLVPDVPAREVNMDVQGGLTVASSYVWRGRVVNDETVFQPEVLIKVDPFSLDIWGTWDVEGTKDTPERTRIDFTLDYTIPREKIDLRFGAVAHAFHDDPGGHASDTYEVFGEVAGNGFLNPSLMLYYDFGTINAFYGYVRIADYRSLFEKADLETAMHMGFGSGRFNEIFFQPAQSGEGASLVERKFALVDLMISAAVPYRLKESTTLQPKIEYVRLMNGDMRDIMKADGRKTEKLVASLTLAVRF